jgi:hypothetical protein
MDWVIHLKGRDLPVSVSLTSSALLPLSVGLAFSDQDGESFARLGT